MGVLRRVECIVWVSRVHPHQPSLILLQSSSGYMLLWSSIIVVMYRVE